MNKNCPEIIWPDWDAPKNIMACTTTRGGGFSQHPWYALNLADHVGDNPADVDQNRSLLLDVLKLPSDPVWLDQVHGCEVAMIDESAKKSSSDASVTGRSGVVCAVLTADCLPLLLCDKGGTQVAAVHAGWRGLVAGVIEQAVMKMACSTNEIMAWMGPAIGPDVFEVGQEVRDAFVDFNTSASQAFRPQGEKWLCDIYRLARQRLMSMGVTEISGGNYCTYTDAERFYSYRRDGVTGRMGSLIWIN